MSSTKSSAWASPSSSRQQTPERVYAPYVRNNPNRFRRLAPYALAVTAPFALYGAYRGIKYLTKPQAKSPSSLHPVNFSNLI